MKLAWLNIPAELTARKQWAVSTMRIDPVTGKPDKAPRHPVTGALLSVTEPYTWATFEEAINSGYPAIGFLLTADDPYCIFDLDNKEQDPQKAEQLEKIVAHFKTYTERSVSGTGFHIIGRGMVGGARRREPVELYDRARYMIMTGDGERCPILDVQADVDGFIQQMGLHPDEGELPPSIPSSLSDDEVIARASNAKNGERFKELFFTPYPLGDDKSSRDLALANILVFYTQDHEQLLRLWRRSALYRTDKEGYKNPVKYEQGYVLGLTFKAALQRINSERAADLEMGRDMANSLLAQAAAAKNTPPPVTFPPGLVGDVASYIYKCAYLPVPEIALSGALAFVAGLVGREFNIEDQGLNLYVVLLAASGRGKDAPSKAISRIVHSVKNEAPVIHDFMGPSGYASGQGFQKEVATRLGYVSMFAEFGHLLKRITDPRANGADLAFRQNLMGMYSFSGHGRVFYGHVYSDKEKNIPEIASPAFSFFGDTTPEMFYRAFNSENIEEGLLPRFVVVRYDGPRVDDNEEHNHPVPQVLKDHLVSLVTSVANLRHQQKVMMVEMTLEAREIMRAFQREVTARINGTKNNNIVNIWNRAALNAKRIAGVIAVGQNHFKPVITAENVNFAIDLIRRGTTDFEEVLSSGEFGDKDTDQLPLMVKIVKEFFCMPPDQRLKAKYITEPYLKHPDLIPYNYFNQRLRNLKAFKANNRTVDNIARAIKEAEDLGYIQAVNASQLALRGFHVRANTQTWVLGPDFPSGLVPHKP